MLLTCHRTKLDRGKAAAARVVASAQDERLLPMMGKKDHTTQLPFPAPDPERIQDHRGAAPPLSSGPLHAARGVCGVRGGPLAIGPASVRPAEVEQGRAEQAPPLSSHEVVAWQDKAHITTRHE